MATTPTSSVPMCSACHTAVEHDHGSRGVVFTFGLRYPEFMEEIDIVAPTYASAKVTALAVAAEMYEPGFTLTDMQPGGSGGMVQGWSS